jgi:hypothetical protein
MGNLIRVDFNKGSRVMGLQDARRFLGSGFFRKALFDWSIEELTRTANAGEAWLTDAGEAYTAILNFRLGYSKPIAPVIPLKRAA